MIQQNVQIGISIYKYVSYKIACLYKTFDPIAELTLKICESNFKVSAVYGDAGRSHHMLVIPLHCASFHEGNISR